MNRFSNPFPRFAFRIERRKSDNHFRKTPPKKHPSISYTTYTKHPLRVLGAGANPIWQWGERWGTTQTLCQCITGNSEAPINQSCMSLDCVRKHPEKTHTDTRTYKLHTERPRPAMGFKPRAFSQWGNRAAVYLVMVKNSVSQTVWA